MNDELSRKLKEVAMTYFKAYTRVAQYEDKQRLRTQICHGITFTQQRSLVINRLLFVITSSTR